MICEKLLSAAPNVHGHLGLPARLRVFSGGARGARALLFPYLRQRQSRADGNHIEDGVRRIGGQAQPMKLLPRTNANIRRIRIRALLGQLAALPLLALMLFVRKALSGSLDVCGRQYHARGRPVKLPTGYTSK